MNQQQTRALQSLTTRIVNRNYTSPEFEQFTFRVTAVGGSADSFVFQVSNAAPDGGPLRWFIASKCLTLIIGPRGGVRNFKGSTTGRVAF